MNKKNIAIFASGEGTNALALLQKAREFSHSCEVRVLICDRPNAPVLEKFKNFKEIDCFLTKEENEILQKLRERDIHWIFLAGYMKILSSVFIQEFSDRIVNIHPSLLPEFPGLNAYERAFDSGVDIHGVTVHFVDEGVDTGPIIAQEKFKRRESDTLNDFIERGKRVEHQLYGEVLEKIATDRI